MSDTEPRQSAESVRVISYGGGVQSTALIVLACTGRLGKIDAALFANVGDDSEHPATLKYVRDVAVPWAAERGLAIHELVRTKRDGTVETLRGRITNPKMKSICAPWRGENGAPQVRDCTSDFKVDPITRWLKAHGATNDHPATVCIGISLDEIERSSNKQGRPSEIRTYPLLDLRMTRADCAQVIRDAGLPVPPKSACYFCPYHSPRVWSEMRRDEPELFEQAAELEDFVLLKQAAGDRRPLYLTGTGRPIREAVNEAQPTLFKEGPEVCDSGYCWT